MSVDTSLKVDKQPKKIEMWLCTTIIFDTRIEYEGLKKYAWCTCVIKRSKSTYNCLIDMHNNFWLITYLICMKSS